MKTQHTVAVVGVDMGPTGGRAVREAIRLMSSGSIDRVHMLHVVDPNRIIDDKDQPTLLTAEQALERAPQQLEAFALDLVRSADLQLAPERFRGHARVGEYAATLLQMCVDYDADLLIVGTHGRRGFDRWLDGSVAERVMRDARCPVLVARAKNYQNATKTVLPDRPYAPGEEPRHQREVESHTFAPTTISSWAPHDDGPTGFRIV